MIGTGIWIFPDRPAPELIAFGEACEAAGLTELWIGDEGPAREPFAVLSAIGARTTKLRLGIGITNPFIRPPAVTALQSMTIHEATGGRFILGLGAGGDMALRPFGLKPQRPLSACRQALATIRAVADGREDSASGYRPAAYGFRAPELAVYIGARGERFNRWASEAADGVFIAGVAPAVVGDVIGWARSVRQVDISLYVSCSFAPEQVERTRPRMLHAFLNGPAALRTRAGLAMADLQAASDALASGDDRAARALITEDRLAMVHFSGDPVAVAERIVALARSHQPNSVGITMLGDEFDAASAALHYVRKELS